MTALKKQPTAKLFMHDRSQAVRLPKEFRMPGKEVRVSRVGDRIVLEPMDVKFDMDAWRARLEALGTADVLLILRYGIEKSDRAEKLLAELTQFLAGAICVVLFDAEDAEDATDIRAHLERAGPPIGPYDLLIAAQARRRGVG